MKKTPFVFQAYPAYPPNNWTEISDAPIDKFRHGQIYHLTKDEAQGCPWWVPADGRDLQYRIIHGKP